MKNLKNGSPTAILSPAGPLAVIALALTVVMSGCATQVPVKRDTGSLNLHYKVAGAAPRTDKTIAIVSPQVTSISGDRPTSSAAPANTLLAALMAQQGVGNAGSFSGQMTFEKSYKNRLNESMYSSLQEIVSSKGFPTKGPFATFDDIPFSDKKSIYLVAVPSLRIFVDQKSENRECKNSGMACTDEGTISITGELLYKMVEPLTNQAMMTKRVNLSDFGIQKRYFHQYQLRTRSDGLVGTLFDKALAPTELRDNTDLVMTDAMNEFFQMAMAKIDTFVSQEELLSYEADVAQLKGLKRY